jgi:DNA recombination protein RmuC
MQAWIAVVAALAGIAIGFLLRNLSAKSERSLIEAQKTRAEADAALLRAQLSEVQSLADSRAGFESLAAERQSSIARLAAERDALKSELQTHVGAAQQSASRISQLEADLANERKNTAEKVALLKEAEATFSNHFETLAGKVLDSKSDKLKETNKTEIDNILSPLKTEIAQFKTQVESAQRESLVGRTELAAELNHLKDMNKSLTDEAHSLSTALRQDTQKQGHWGEKILLQILENSGLRKDEHYTYQESHSFENEDGEKGVQRTDVILRLPEGRHLIIDSKVTLKAYTDYVNAIDEDARKKATNRLLDSFRKHYTELASRNYHRLAGVLSPDFVVLFAPLEPAFLHAIREDASLWEDAYQKGVLLTGPTSILFVLRIVETLWSQAQQQKNVQKIMDRGEKLYEKFVGFVDDLEIIGAKIKDANDSYGEAMKKLKTGPGNLIRQVELLREDGLKPRKKLKPKLLEAAGLDSEPLALAANAEDTNAEQ